MSITSVSLSGEQLANFAWIKSGQLTPSEIEDYLSIQFSDVNTPSDLATLFFAKFNGTLDAGSYASTGESIVGWSIYRQKQGESALRYIASVSNTDTQIIDHLVENGTVYTYYIFPEGFSTMGSPIVSDPVSSKAWNWTIFTATESAKEGVLTVTHAYVFQGNVQTDSMSNNSDSTVMRNFTKYPKIIKGTSNYKSGTLSALIGAVDMQTNTYIEEKGLRDALYALTTTNERTFLKNRAGDVWEVSIHSAIDMNVSDNSAYQPNTAKIEWTEIAATNDISLVSAEDL